MSGWDEKPPFCLGCGEEGHLAEDCELGRVKVCRRCGEEGHYSNQCTSACPNCDKDHLPGDCPTTKVTCFLCEGSDHCPKECSMSLVIARSLKLQRLLLRSSASIAIANASKPEKFLDDLSEELRDRLPVYTFPDFQLVVENPVVAGGRKRKLKDRCKCQEKTQGDFSKVANVTCFFCKLQGHYANNCPKKLAATPRPLQAVPQSRVPASQPDGPRNPFARITCFFCSKKGHYANTCPLKQQKITCSRAKSLSAGRVQEAPDVVSGMLCANSHSATVLSNSGATSRSFPPPVIQSHAPAKHRDWRVVCNPVDSISAEKAQDTPDVVLGTLLSNSYPDIIRFNSGASHSFVSPSFAAVGDLHFALLIGAQYHPGFKKILLVYPKPQDVRWVVIDCLTKVALFLPYTSKGITSCYRLKFRWPKWT